MKGVAHGLGREVELPGNVAVDDGGYERDGVVVFTEKRDAEEEVVKAVVVTVVLDSREFVFEDVLGDRGGPLTGSTRVDLRVRRADG